jgi:hypothetical protein
MKFTFLILFSIAVFFAGCTINVNQPNSSAENTRNSTVPASTVQTLSQSPWSVVVCSSRANSVTLSAGASDATGEVFATWKQNTPQKEFTLPAELQNFSRVYFKGSASDKNQVEMCILYDGNPKKRIEFDDDEDVFVASTDTDELDRCRCAR